MHFQSNSDAGHRIYICSECQFAGAAKAEAKDSLSARLGDALRQAVCSADLATFEILGVACMAGCGYPCTVAFQAQGKASYLFGDIQDDEDIEALAAFACQYAGSSDGWTSTTSRPAALSQKTLARIPGSLTLPASLVGRSS